MVIVPHLDLTHEESRAVLEICEGCYCDTEVMNARGEKKRGFYNLKRIYGSPSLLKASIRVLTRFLKSETLCAPDDGAAPLVGALAFATGRASVYVRRAPKYYYLSYGHSSVSNSPNLMGEQLPSGISIDLIDDVLSHGSTALNAIRQLADQGIRVRQLLCILQLPKDPPIEERLRDAGISEILSLARLQ